MTGSLIRQGEFKGKFSLLIVTTLEKLLLSIRTSDKHGTSGHMKLLAVDRSVGALFRMLGAPWRSTLGQNDLAGVHLPQSDEIRIAGERSNAIRNGAVFAATGRKTTSLHSQQMLHFLSTVECDRPRTQTT